MTVNLGNSQVLLIFLLSISEICKIGSDIILYYVCAKYIPQNQKKKHIIIKEYLHKNTIKIRNLLKVDL